MQLGGRPVEQCDRAGLAGCERDDRDERRRAARQLHDRLEALALVGIADEDCRQSPVVLVDEGRQLRSGRISGVTAHRDKVASLVEVRVSTPKGMDPLLSIGGDER